MSVVRSRNWLAQGVTGVWASIVTVPGGRTALVKTVTVYSWAAAAGQVHLAVRSAAAVEYIVHRATLGPDSTLTLAQLIVLEEGPSLRIHLGGTNAGWHAMASGSLLSGVPT